MIRKKEKFKSLMVVLLFLSVGISCEISCRTEENQKVDWYINYKLPKIGEEPKNSYLGNGTAYAYITAPGSSSWTLSSKGIDHKDSMMANTLKQVYSHQNKLAYLFYNDQTPLGFSGESPGHLKGGIKYWTNWSCRMTFKYYTMRYINYKLPKIGEEPEDSNLGNGTAYVYITAPGSSSFTLASKGIHDKGSMMDNTLKNVYSNKKHLAYLFFNEQPPSNFSGESAGHVKGVVAFDGNTGFWLIHSIPKFADDNFFEYPANALVNGQSILCVTFPTSQLKEISNQLLFLHPNIYSRGITPKLKALLDDKTNTLFTDNPLFATGKPFTREASLKSLDNKTFVSYASNNQFKKDIFSSFIAPGLKSSLLLETWRNGKGSLPAYCRTKYFVSDLIEIKMTVGSGRNSKSIFFKSTDDHSKWAFSDGDESNWVCIADVNRMFSQRNRAGGALCFTSALVKKAYSSTIYKRDRCQSGTVVTTPRIIYPENCFFA